MKTLRIEATKQSPQIIINGDGKFLISGRLINDHLMDFFHPIFLWIDKLVCENVKLEINLEYLNTAGTFYIAKLIHRIEANKSIKTIDVIWLYEEDDEEHHDLGLFIEEKMNRSSFKYLSYV